MTFKYSADLDEFIRNNPSYEKIINFLLEYLNEYAPQEEKTYRKDTDTPIGNLNLYEKAEAYLLKFLSFMRGIDEGIPYDFSEYEINSNVKLLYSVFKGSAWREYIGYLETHLNEYLEKSKNMRFSNIQNLKDLIRLAKDGSNVSKIFLDLDGVLVDFDGGFKKISGMLPSQLPRPEGRGL